MNLQERPSRAIEQTGIFGPPDLDEYDLQDSENDVAAKEGQPLACKASDHHASTGPRTPEGKAISSQNATKHGCRSKTLILRHESHLEYEVLHKSWWNEYQPSGHTEETLVQQLIDNHWFLNRACNRLEQVEWELPTNVFEWTDAHKKLLNTFQRYKTAAERAYHKSFRTVEAYLRECVRSENATHKADLLRRKIEAQIANKPAEVRQIATQMAIPLYLSHRDRAAARAGLHFSGSTADLLTGRRVPNPSDVPDC